MQEHATLPDFNSADEELQETLGRMEEDLKKLREQVERRR